MPQPLKQPKPVSQGCEIPIKTTAQSHHTPKGAQLRNGFIAVTPTSLCRISKQNKLKLPFLKTYITPAASALTTAHYNSPGGVRDGVSSHRQQQHPSEAIPLLANPKVTASNASELSLSQQANSGSLMAIQSSSAPPSTLATPDFSISSLFF